MNFKRIKSLKVFQNVNISKNAKESFILTYARSATDGDYCSQNARTNIECRFCPQ